MYSRSTSVNTGSALLVGCVVVLLVIIAKPLLTTFSVPLSYPGSWWRFETSKSQDFPAHIYKMPDNLLPNILVIKSKQDLIVGQKVYTPNQELLGPLVATKKIAGDTIGWVSLISNNQEKILVTFSVEGVLTHVEARGRGQGVFMAQLPGVTKVAMGEAVTLSSTGELLGTIVGVRSNEQDPFQRVFVAPKVQLRSLPGLLVE